MNDNMDLEQLRDQASAAVYKLTKEQLLETSKYLKCISESDETAKSKTQRFLIKTMEELLDAVEEEQDQEEACQFVKDLLDFVEKLPAEGTSKSNAGELRQLEELKKQYLQMQKAQAEVKEAIEKEIKTLSEKLVQVDKSSKADEDAIAHPVKVPEVTIRREFRICGQIDEEGQKDKLSYTNLLHQINAGLQKGHSEAEVIEAVIKAICPGLSLRNMLEIKTDLTLSKLKIILKSHFKAENASDLYHKLVNITQEPRESAQNFLFRAIELKDKLLVASAERGAEEQYDADLVRRKFLRSVGTGLLNDSLKFEIKSYLEIPDVADEVLIKKLNEAASLETERQQKMKKNAVVKTSRANEFQAEVKVNANMAQHDTRAKQEQQAQIEPDEHMGPATPLEEKGKNKRTYERGAESDTREMVQELRTEMAELRKMLVTSLENSYKPPQWRPTGTQQRTRPKGCRACIANGAGES